MLKKNQPSLQDLALNNVSTRNPPTPAFLHKSVPEIFYLPKKNKQNNKPPLVQTPGGPKLHQP
jgi:hypothetical protein